MSLLAVSPYRAMSADRGLLLIVALVAMTGIAAVGSAAVSHAGFNGQIASTVVKHLRDIVLGLAVATMAYSVSLDRYQQYSRLMVVLSIIGLILVFVPGIGHEVNGSKRWIKLGLFNFQPSEMVKVVAILYTSDYVVRQQQSLTNTVGGVIRPVVLFAIVAGLVLLEPDLGATIVIFASIMLVLFLGGAQMRTFIMLVVAGLLAVTVLAVGSTYRLERVMSFLNPWDDPFGSDYQLLNSLIAVGRGGLNGVGWSSGYQKLGFLPEAHTDFIFAVWSEELGFIGVALLIALYAALIATIWQRARRAEAVGLLYGALVAYGVAFWFSFQAFVNTAVNLGMLPPKGITLPLISFGGSSLLVTFAALGIVLRVSVETMEREGKL